MRLCSFFFFQAEDGIRDVAVTGVQTCALPISQLAARHDVVAITIDDPRERHLPDAGWVDMEDAETGQRVLVDTSHGPTRTRVSVAAERQLQERTRKLAQAGVDRVALQTSVPYGVVLRRAFAERARRLKR